MKTRILSCIRSLSLGLAMLLVLGAPLPVQAQDLDGKVQELGKLRYLSVSEIRSTRRNGFLAVQAELRNASVDDRQLFYRIRWMDQDGFAVGGEEVWKPVLFHGKQKQVIQAVAPTLQAADFKIELQSPDNYGMQPDSD